MIYEFLYSHLLFLHLNEQLSLATDAASLNIVGTEELVVLPEPIVPCHNLHKLTRYIGLYAVLKYLLFWAYFSIAHLIKEIKTEGLKLKGVGKPKIKVEI